MRLLKVYGEGQAQAEPDTATLSLNVTGVAKEYATAVNQLNSTTERLKSSVQASQLPITELKTSDFSIHTETKYENGQSIDIGYRASHRMSVVLDHDKQVLNDLIELMSHSQSNAEFQVLFSLKNPEVLRQQALQNAVIAAQNNAHTLASTALLQLGKVQEIVYGDMSGLNGISPRAYGGGYDSAPMMSVAKADIEPQDVQVRESVIMVFELLD